MASNSQSTLPVAAPSSISEAALPSGASNTATPAISTAPTIEKQGEESDPEKGSEKGTSPSRSSLESLAEAPARSITGLRWLLICLSLYISAFLYGLDTTIAADVQGPVVEDFGHVEQLPWIGAGFPLGSVASILLVGNLFGHFNMKYVFIGGAVMFEIGSALCGAAPDMNALIVGRVLAGCGGAGIYLGGLNYFSYLTVPTERGLYITLIGFFWGVGAVVGPLVGGAFSESSATWRWAFYINLVIGAVVAPIYIFFLPSIHPLPGKTIRERIASFDFLGLFLAGAAWVLFTVAFSMGGAQWAWSDGRTIALIVIFAVVLIAVVLQQYFTVFTTVAHRAVPGHLLLSRTQVLLVIATACSITSLFVVVYYIPIYFQFVNSDRPVMAAVRLLPFVVVSVVTNVSAGHLLSRVKYYAPVFLASGILITIGGAVLMVYLDPATSTGTIYGLTIVVAFGTGLSLQIGYAVATLSVVPADIGNAINLQNVAQIGGSTVALVIAGQVFNSEVAKTLSVALAGHGFTAEQIASAAAGAQSEFFRSLDGELRGAAIAAIVHAMQRSFVLVISSGAIMVVAAACMKFEKLF
ncbi:major facilitator superfamily domain-containing protein [Lasiosphaeris hirsuta]|uniref:Major facilitator superfamily domain-containing protein n=1 Tax=Lasiosphaeris hirsuta TaxID=260670 RepID=A0AA40AZ58_9PEZI|nr:major facilitator superfamily domain-containing protein [Lasiosphaeris hirsuta]